MAGTTPPKGKPTAGRLDRQVAARRAWSRGRARTFVWIIAGVSVLVAVIWLGSGSGNGVTNGTTTNVVLPLFLFSRPTQAGLIVPRR